MNTTKEPCNANELSITSKNLPKKKRKYLEDSTLEEKFPDVQAIV